MPPRKSSRQKGKRPEDRVNLDVEETAADQSSARWDRTYSDAENLIGNAVPETDPFLYHLLQRHFHELETLPEMDDKKTLLGLIALFVDHLDGSTAVREGAIYLARSEWDLELAIANYRDETIKWSGEEESEADSETESELGETEELLSEGADDSEDSKAEHDVPTAEKEAINKHIDRKPAVKGVENDSKFVIKINLVKGGEMVLRFRAYNRGADFDWSNQAHIRDLNRWRSQTFLRHLGAVRPPVIPYLPEELDFITQTFNDHLKAHRTQHPNEDVKWTRMDWNIITKDFNSTFEGTIPSGGAPRPLRSRKSLMTQRYRIQAVCAMTGKPLKTDQTLKGKGPKKRVRWLGDDGQGGVAEDKGGEE